MYEIGKAVLEFRFGAVVDLTARYIQVEVLFLEKFKRNPNPWRNVKNTPTYLIRKSCARFRSGNFGIKDKACPDNEDAEILSILD